MQGKFLGISPFKESTNQICDGSVIRIKGLVKFVADLLLSVLELFVQGLYNLNKSPVAWRETG
jgi:hypothetical protein